MSDKPILIVDDEPHIRFMLEMKFSSAGYTVLTANEGRRAFELACAHLPMLVLTDLQMPGCDGLELCRKLAQNPATAAIPVIMLTARGHRVPAEMLKETNIKLMFDKPFSLSELLVAAKRMYSESTPDSEASAA